MTYWKSKTQPKNTALSDNGAPQHPLVDAAAEADEDAVLCPAPAVQEALPEQEGIKNGSRKK